MIVYCAGAPGPADVEAALTADGLLRSRLVTYADRGQVARVLDWRATCGTPAHLFLDSGAFSVQSRGASIDVGAYCEFVAEHAPALSAYAALDVIGDAAATDRNVREMQRRGLQPVPTFHMSSPWPVLERMCEEFGYIALGGWVGTAARGLQHTEANLSAALDGAFDIVGRHWPRRVHLFSLAQPWILERYPAFSVDSTSARRGAGMGVVQAQASDGTWRWSNWRAHARGTWDGAVADGVSSSPEHGRWRHNLRAQAAVERYATDLWARRGVSWT